MSAGLCAAPVCQGPRLLPPVPLPFSVCGFPLVVHNSCVLCHHICIPASMKEEMEKGILLLLRTLLKYMMLGIESLLSELSLTVITVCK